MGCFAAAVNRDVGPGIVPLYRLAARHYLRQPNRTLFTMTEVRQPAVAGTFYPGAARDLDAAIQSYVSQVTVPGGPAPKAIIAPHAGYV